MTTDPDAVARLAARYIIADSGGTAGAVIFTDSQFAVARRKVRVMQAELDPAGAAGAAEIDTPLSSAQVAMPTLVTSLLQRHRARFRYLLTINGAYIGGARTGLVGAGRRPGDPPFGVAAGDGDASEFERIRSGDYQRASIAEPLYLQGWQLIDELNRAAPGAGVGLRRPTAAHHARQCPGRQRVRPAASARTTRASGGADTASWLDRGPVLLASGRGSRKRCDERFTPIAGSLQP